MTKCYSGHLLMSTAYDRRVQQRQEEARRWAPPSWSPDDVLIVQACGKGLDTRETAESLGMPLSRVRRLWFELLKRECETEGASTLAWRFLPALEPEERARLEQRLRCVSPRQQTLLCLLASGWGGHAAGAWSGFHTPTEVALAGELAWEALELGRWATWKPRVMLRGVEFDERLLLLREPNWTSESAWGREGMQRVCAGLAARADGDARLSRGV